MNPPTHELEAFFNGEHTADDLATLESWINTEPTNAKFFLDQLRFRELVGEHVRQQASDTSALMSELALLEPEWVGDGPQSATATLAVPEPEHRDDPAALSTSEILGVSGYLLRKALVSRPALYAYAAALVLIVAVIYLPWGDGSEQTARHRTEPGQIVPLPVVAQITGEADASWSVASGASAPFLGERLHPGRRLVLAEGSAEITTNDGAVAVLQGPCTIELTDSDNAFRLHTGRLVGVCETASSKGFVVHTPGMDVTDLSTRFGVDVRDDTTEVHVIEGAVDVSTAAADGQGAHQRLIARQAIVYQTGGAFEDIDYDRERFAFALPGTSPAPPEGFGSVVWFGEPPAGRIPESESLQVFLEAPALTLTEDLVVDFTADDAWPPERQRGTYVVPAGTTVDVYLVHLDTPGNANFRGSFQVRFDQPILGVIGSDGGFSESDALVSASPELKTYPSRGVALDDRITITDDGRAMNLSLRVAEPTDHVRVLVLSN